MWYRAAITPVSIAVMSAGVARSASPIGRSLKRSSAETFLRSDHPVCACASLGAATPPLRGGEFSKPNTRKITILALAAALFLAAVAYAQEFKIHAKIDLVVVPVTVK